MSESSKKKRFRIFIADVKLRHTPHWDQDFMSREELDAVYGVQTRDEAGPPAEKKADDGEDEA